MGGSRILGTGEASGRPVRSSCKPCDIREGAIGLRTRIPPTQCPACLCLELEEAVSREHQDRGKGERKSHPGCRALTGCRSFPSRRTQHSPQSRIQFRLDDDALLLQLRLEAKHAHQLQDLKEIKTTPHWQKKKKGPGFSLA